MSIAVLQIVHPLSCIRSTVLFEENSFSLHISIDPLSLVHFTICKYSSSCSIRLIFLPIPFKNRFIPIELFSPSISHLIFPLTMVNSACLIFGGFFPLEGVGRCEVIGPQFAVNLFDGFWAIESKGLYFISIVLGLVAIVDKVDVESGLSIDALAGLTVAHIFEFIIDRWQLLKISYRLIQYHNIFIFVDHSAGPQVELIIIMPHNISYTHIASILLKQINRIRNDPTLLLPVLEERKKKYDQEGNYYPLTGLNFSVRTKEGRKGVQNLIEYVKKQRQSPSLEWSYELHQAADKRCHFLSSSQEQNVLNRVANLQIGELVSEFTTWKGQLVELTFYGFIEPREYICELLLEDGREQKENRMEFFNRMACYVGIGINTHEKYRFVIVLIMANQVASHEPIASAKQFREDSIRESSQSINKLIRKNSKSVKIRESANNIRESGSGSNRARQRKNSNVSLHIAQSSRDNGQRPGEGPVEGNPRASEHEPYFQTPIYHPGQGAVQNEREEEQLQCTVDDCLIY